VKKGTATLANLRSPSAIANGVVQRGVGSDDYPCNDDGNDCTDIFAVSILGVSPSAFITWFQAQQAAANSGKRLLTNAEWQMAAAGTPDPGNTPGASDCATNSGGADTGTRSNCVSRFGVFDMVGNFFEWVADWVPLSTTCPPPLFAGDLNCLAGASTTSGPGALIRGGDFLSSTSAGVFAVTGSGKPSSAFSSVGFRCGR
jgi:formylglycine-generating enzyme required for sulfatase activity